MPQGAEDEVAKFALTVNGSRRIVDVARDTPLLWVLRDTLDLRGTKYGCGRGVCGACTVHADGQAIRSCVTTLESVAQQQITTIEALSKDGNHPVQRAWSELDVAQCGYCQAGQMMMAAALLSYSPHPTEEELQKTMSNNLCRCGTYLRIRQAVRRASELAEAGHR